MPASAIYWQIVYKLGLRAPVEDNRINGRSLVLESIAFQEDFIADIAIVVDPGAVGASDFNRSVRAGATVAEILKRVFVRAVIGPGTNTATCNADLKFDASAGRLSALPNDTIDSSFFFHIKRD